MRPNEKNENIVSDLVRLVVPAAHLIDDNGVFPNNPVLPLLVYSEVWDPSRAGASGIEAVFDGCGWPSAWRNGIYDFHHYHSTAHEALGVVRGRARVQFGGEGGVILPVTAGDVVVIPAGVSHKNSGDSGDFLIVGAYPAGQQWDMKRGRPGERPQADENIRQVPLPQEDPVFGPQGPLTGLWASPADLQRPFTRSR